MKFRNKISILYKKMLGFFFNSLKKNNRIFCKKIKNSYIFRNNFSNGFGFLDSIYIEQNDKEENDLLHLLPLNRNRNQKINDNDNNDNNENNDNDNDNDNNDNNEKI
jgi:hypothetical protein